jgi:hypothetical protein
MAIDWKTQGIALENVLSYRNIRFLVIILKKIVFTRFFEAFHFLVFLDRDEYS